MKRSGWTFSEPDGDGDRFYLRHLHAQAAMNRAARMSAFLDGIRAEKRAEIHPDAHEWLARQHLRIVRTEEREAEIRRAPPEVVHRRVAGETVIGRRLWARRTT